MVMVVKNPLILLKRNKKVSILILFCYNCVIHDKFSTLNDKAKLKYKVGLMSYREMNLLGNANIRKTRQYYWLAFPYILGASGWVVSSNGDLDSLGVAYGVRSAVSLTPCIKYSDGDESMENPYIVITE